MKLYVKCEGRCGMLGELLFNQRMPANWKNVCVYGVFPQIDLLICDKCFATEYPQLVAKVDTVEVKHG